MAGAITSNQHKDVGNVGREQTELPPLDHGPLDLQRWFAFPDALADAPLELEIGAGKGTFLVSYAAAHPDRRFIGIEWARAYYIHAADRLRRHGIANARMLRAEAGAFVRNFVAEGALAAVRVYFPDPWPKKRHHKRRLIQAPFLRELHRVLGAGGKVHLATDHADYFVWMTEHAAAVVDEGLFERLPFERPVTAGEGELVGTNFERKYRDQGGRTFQGMTLVKRTP